MTRVLYVAGWSYSGSTIIGRTLTEADAFFAAGELRHVWRDGFLRDEVCGCGAAFSRCPFWGAVTLEAFGRAARVNARALVAEQERALRNRHVLRGPSPSPSYLEAVGRLYRAVGSVSGARVIVDTSKTPLYGALLERAPGLDVRVLHLVRDSRAALAARVRRGYGAHPVVDLSLWALWHLAAERRWGSMQARYLRLRYEDFARRPHDALDAIARLAGEPDATFPVDESHEISLRPGHGIRGNPNKFQRGRTEIVLDERWRSELPIGGRVLASVWTWPLLLRYGYLASQKGLERNFLLRDHALQTEQRLDAPAERAAVVRSPRTAEGLRPGVGDVPGVDAVQDEFVISDDVAGIADVGDDAGDAARH